MKKNPLEEATSVSDPGDRPPSQNAKKASTAAASISVANDASVSLDTHNDPQDPLVGKKIGRYEILAKVAKGGTATVYRARDTNLKRDVAVKIIHEHLEARQEVVKRFRNEAELIAQLRNQNIVNVYDFLEVEGRAVLVVEYMPGITLSQLYQEVKRLPEDYVIMMGLEILNGLKAAHSKGITHRDIKPANILLHPELGIKISDFGLAKLITADDGLTKSGIFVGTPSFSSPEQIEGRPVDHRSDLFSLGLTLYLLATRSHAFKKQGDSTTTVWFKIVRGRFDPVRERNPDLSTEFEQITNRALEVSLERRYQSADEMIVEFERILKSRGLFPYQDQLREFLRHPDKAKDIVRAKLRFRKSSLFKLLAGLVLIACLSSGYRMRDQWLPQLTWLQEKTILQKSETPVLPEQSQVQAPAPVVPAQSEPAKVLDEPAAKTEVAPAASAEAKIAVKKNEKKAAAKPQIVGPKPAPLDIPSAIPIRDKAQIILSSTSAAAWPGLRLSVVKNSNFQFFKSNASEAFLQGVATSDHWDLPRLSSGSYTWKSGDKSGEIDIESLDSYRSKLRTSKRALNVAAEFGDVDVELNPWTQALKFLWTSGPGAALYRIEVASDPEFKHMIFSASVSTKFIMIERFWEKNQTLFWRASYLDENRNVFLVDPTRKLNLTLRGSAPFVDFLAPQNLNPRVPVEVKAVAPEIVNLRCSWLSKNAFNPSWMNLKTQGSYQVASFPAQADAIGLLCEAKQAKQSLYFVFSSQRGQAD